MLGSGMISSFDRYSNKVDLGQKLTRTLSVHVPHVVNCTAVGCGFNTFTQSAVNAACTVCNGTGQVTTWHMGYVRARVSWVDPARVDIYKGIASGEVGDVQIQGFQRDLALYTTIKDTVGAYILVDGQKVKPNTITQNYVESPTTLDVRCKLITEQPYGS
jgi:hypothetical protein